MAGQILVVSDGTLVPSDRLVDAISRGGSAATLERDPAHALTRLRTLPRTVVVDAAMPGAERFVGRIRSEGALVGCAVIAIVPRVSDTVYAEALAWGADEVVPAGSMRALSQAATAVKDHDPAVRPPVTEGTVLVAATSATDRLARARPLRNVGFDVVFAGTGAEFRAQADRTDLAMVVADADVFADGAAGLRAFCAASARPVIAVASSAEVDGLTGSLAAAPRVRVVARHDPPEDAIFIGNDLLRPSYANSRASARALHATVASFRLAGEDTPNHGVTYNVSLEGIYVRTMSSPPSGSDIWLELRPPTDDALVHLEGKVVWVRKFGPSAGATAPPGFAVRVDGGSQRALARWAEGYHRLLRGRASPPEVTRASAVAPPPVGA